MKNQTPDAALASLYEQETDVVDAPTRIIAISPKGIWALLMARLSGEHVYIIDVGNRLPVFRSLWLRISNFVCNKGWARPIDDMFPDADRYFVRGWMADFPDMFWKLEAGMIKDYALDQLNSLPDYSLAISHVSAQYAEKLLIVATVNRLSKGGRYIKSVTGIDDTVISWYQRYFGDASAFPCTGVRSGMISAILTWALVTGFGLAWIIRRLRFSTPQPLPYFLGADFILDKRMAYMVKQITEHPGQVLFVFRNRSQQCEADNWPPFSGFQGLHPDDLSISLKDGIGAAWQIVRDTSRILRHCWRYPDGLFFGAVKLPLRRAAYRILFKQRPFKYFLSRDDYNAEHIIRSQELRKSGAVSLGLAHGVMAPSIVNTRTRYIDFDIYYVFGLYPYPQHHVANWPGHVRLKPVGTLGMTREHQSQLEQPKTSNIIFFVSRLIGERKFIQDAVKLAKAFPDRQVIIKPKYSPRSIFHLDFFSLISDPPANLIQSWENSYDLMTKCRYAVSNGSSSIVAEAVQFGVMAYVWDSFPKNIPFYYRAFPEICIADIDQVIANIRDIEAGQSTYPWEKLGDLVDLSKNSIYDVIRADMGLSPKPSATANSSQS